MLKLHSFMLCTTLFCAPLTGAQNPLTFNIAGVPVSANEMATAVAATVQAVEQAAQNNRTKKELAINKLNQQLIELGKKADKGLIGANEYEQNKMILVKAIDRLNNELETINTSAATLGNNMQNVLMSGWQAVLNRFKEEEERKTRIAEVAVGHTIENEGALERLRFFSQTENLKQYALFSTAICLGACGSYYGAKLAHQALMLTLEKQPDWIEESSYHGMWNSILETLPSFLYAPKPVPTFDQTIVLEPELEIYMKEIALITKTAHEKGLPYQSILLHGLPGTGKTLYAKFLAHTLGIPYVIVKISKLQSFKEGQDLEELDYLFKMANNSPDGMLVFIDEIDTLGRDKSKLSERWLRILNLYLQYTGESSEKLIVVGATNKFEDLEPSFVSRFPHKIKVPLPGAAERERLLNLYVKKHIIDDKREIKRNGTKVPVQLMLSPEIDAEYIHELAQRTEGFSGRSIAQLTEALRAQCYLTDDLVLTKALVERELKRVSLCSNMA